jgi:Ca-activated chloride channel family protein
MARCVGMALRGLFTLLCLALLVGCSSEPQKIAFVAGSENKQLEPLIQDFCKRKNAECSFAYKGSLDIGFGLKPGGGLDADVVWPAASIWIDIFDTERKVKHLKSVSQSPVVLGVRKSKAEALGWTSKPVTMRDILAAVKGRELTFLMSSATQSNSGAAAYLAMLTTMVGADVLTKDDLAKPELRADVRQLLAGVARTSGSSGWLAELFLDQDAKGVHFDAMWNYETVLKETNDALVARGSEPLWIVYPADGVAIADAPIGYLDRGRGEAAEKFVLDLQDYLLSDEAQKQIAATGRRIGLGRAEEAKPVPEWNFDPSRPVTAIRPPEPDLIVAALNLYQEALRRPSFSALCLDVSGSMEGNGIDQLHDAVKFLFSPETTRNLLIQWSTEDRILMIPFSDRLGEISAGTGAAEDQAKLEQAGHALAAGGGTNMYQCAAEALTEMRAGAGSGDYLPAILILTDGKSDDYAQDFLRQWQNDGGRVPVFGIMFGDADPEQLDRLAKETGGRVFDGRTSLVEAFRAARGYN